MTAALERFRAVIEQRLGLAFADDHLTHLEAVLRARSAATGGSVTEYLERLTSPLDGQQEIAALSADLTVGETYFFRNPDQFRALAEAALPARLAARAGERRLRLLSAGCASGEEAYSLAIVLRELSPQLEGWAVAIEGVDVNPAAIARACRARYSAWSLRETPPDVRERYFCREGSDYVVRDEVQAAVSFATGNLCDGAAPFWNPGEFDVIFCRNVAMYFSDGARRALASRLAVALAPGGFLFLGHAECLRGISEAFDLRLTHETFYYQRAQVTGDRYPARPPSVPSTFDARQPPPDTSWVDTIRQAADRVAQLTDSAGRAAASGAMPASAASTGQPVEDAWEAERVLALLRAERFDEAIARLRALPDGAASSSKARLMLAALLTIRGEVAEAAALCEELLAADARNAGAHYVAALCCEHRGDGAAAAAHNHAAMALDATFAMPHLHLGLLAKRAGDRATARRELRRALTLLAQEDATRLLLFGGGFNGDALAQFCRAQLRSCGEGV